MKAKRVVIITGPELRHEFFRKYIALSENILVLRSYCEGGTLSDVIKKDTATCNALRSLHLIARERVEADFFQLFNASVTDKSNPQFIRQGEINDPEIVSAIIGLNPDLIISYGCSIIKPPLIEAFKGRFLNVHLGLSPYYRGSGTNYWPFFNNEPQYVGVTFMHIDAGVDTGEIIHQIRPEIVFGDTIHQIGNRLIRDMTICIIQIIQNFDKLVTMPPIPFDQSKEKYYRNKDFSEASVHTVYENFRGGLIERFLEKKQSLFLEAPIIINPAIKQL